MYCILWKLFKPKIIEPEKDYQVHVSKERITVTGPHGESESLSHNDLVSLLIETNDTGPWGMDVWWRLKGSEGEVFFPSGAVGEDGFLERVQSFKGFDNEQFIAAMRCTENREFVVWTKT